MITLIGDLHGLYSCYHNILREKYLHPHTIQLGDFGFNYETLKNVDSKDHIFIGGNHDNYDKVNSVPNYLGDFGYVVDFHGLDFFFYRGASSIDRQYRTIGVSWWENEELNIEGFMQARELYSKVKPEVMLTHDCPESIYPLILPPGSRILQNRTSWALQELLNIHRPKTWRFGHMHKSWRMTIDGTDFRCLNELETESW